MTNDPAALLAEIESLKARIQDMAREHIAVEGQLEERVADLEDRLARCAGLPEIPSGFSLVIDNLGSRGLRATLRDCYDNMRHDSGTSHPTPADALAALKEAINRK